MKKVFYLLIFLIIAFIAINGLRNVYFTVKEGMSSNKDITSSADGIAGNAESFASSIKSASVTIQDSFLINKYRSSYETIILNMDDLVNNLILKTILTTDPANPMDSIEQLSKLQQSKSALNSAMKFVDNQ